MKRRIRLTESDLHNIVKESVARIMEAEDWESPLDKVKGNKPKIKGKMDVSGYRKKNLHGKIRKDTIGDNIDDETMKKLKKLHSENYIRKAVMESVNRVLNEAAYNMNSPEYKQMYDKGLETHWDREDKAQTNKEIADYEALPDKARHPYGTEIPNFDDRVKKRNGFGFWRPNDGDKLASKKPNSIYNKQQEKRDYEEYMSERYNEAMKDLPFLFDYLHYISNVFIFHHHQ